MPCLSGVYEWVTFRMKPGGPALWGEAFQAAINTHISAGYSKLIGIFHTEYGLLNTGTTQFLIQTLAWEGVEVERQAIVLGQDWLAELMTVLV